ncbi:DegV family protein [Lentibacillus halophilus]|uniref:DegV family protein n=1 Tax=Lentibacillus halophilus TaxID=295065 RepID=A0ABN0Z8S6_9BACI
MNTMILADSACDLTEEHYNAYHIDMVPLTVQLDDQTFKDSLEIKPKSVYDAMREGKHPKTSQVSPQTFKTIFTSYAEKKQPLVYLAFSSELSGTYQAAKIAEQDVKESWPDAELRVIDTKCASIGYGLVILRAAKLAKDGAAIGDIIETARYHANHMEHIFTVDDLDYLYRGGRVSKTAASIGSFLKIKPILHVDDGRLVPLEKIRGSKKVLNRMLDLLEERGADISRQTVGISHGDDAETAEMMRSRIQERFNPADTIVEMVGSTIGAHSGPGTLALFFLNSSYK